MMLFLSFSLFFNSFITHISAEEAEQVEKKPEEEKKNFIKDLTTDYVETDGFIKIYQDPKTSSLYLNIEENLLEQEFIYFAHVTDGVVAARRVRGSYLDNGVFKIKKHFETLRLIRINTSFSYDKNSHLAKSSGANVSNAVVQVFPIIAENEKGNQTSEHSKCAKKYKNIVPGGLI